MAEPFIGQVQTFAFNWSPQDWVLANGQLLPVNQYQALYALTGNAFGGNGTNFNVPNLNGRVPIGQGNFSDNFGSTTYALGVVGGARETALTQANLATHSHPAQATQSGGGPVSVSIGASGDPAKATLSAPTTGSVLGVAAVSSGDTVTLYAPAGTPANVALGGVTATGGGGGPISVVVGSAGNNVPFSVMQPYVALNYSIAAFGLFPQRP